MVSWSFTFLILTLIAAFFAFTGIAAGVTVLARITFFLFLALLIASLILPRVRRHFISSK